MSTVTNQRKQKLDREFNEKSKTRHILSELFNSPNITKRQANAIEKAYNIIGDSMAADMTFLIEIENTASNMAELN